MAPAVERPDTGILTVVCPDRQGIVAAISGFLFGHGANILDAQQHTDRSDETFFMRVRFDATRLDISLAEFGKPFAEVADRFGMRWRIRATSETPSMGIMVSRLDHCLIDLLARHRIGELAVRVPLILSNHADLEPIAAAFNVPFRVVPVTPDSKSEAEAEQLRHLREAGCDFVVLARYMQVLTPTFLAAFPLRVINIHHGFLPAFAGARAYHQALERGVKMIGATSHYATNVLDDGPIIDQDVIRVTHRDTADDLIRKGRDVERIVLARAVRAHAEDRVVVHGRRTVVFD
ncbi:MAG TPA: formyltetrahydrofolate deformylase [Chloroflexota bacterium]|nr:formyltetrahydrofolate deformylase [Chloroflexota bacterium]